ncbi:CheR family methyltransferase [Endothiovibrio diazotrophicus]
MIALPFLNIGRTGESVEPPAAPLAAPPTRRSAQSTLKVARPLPGSGPTVAQPGSIPAMSDDDFQVIQGLFQVISGIRLPLEKKPMVAGRLAKRLRHHGLADFTEYAAMVTDAHHEAELQRMVDLLTTHETYFFREPKHFDLLREEILPQWPADRPCRVWSAACSTGEESYSLAMVLADTLGERAWEVLGSDISIQTVATAETGLYSLDRTDNIPEEYLRRYCRRGVRSYSGTLLVNNDLRERTRFMQLNLTDDLPELGEFDIIFLRNVLIYFDQATKRQIVEQLLKRLRPGGWIFVGHAESLHTVTDHPFAERPAPAVYRKKG